MYLCMQSGKWERASGTVIYSHENEDQEAAFLTVLNQLHVQHLMFMTVGSASYIRICNTYGNCVLDPSALTHKKKTILPFILS